MKMWLSNHQGNQHFTLKLFTLTYMSVLRVFVILSCMCTFICVCCEYPKGLVIRTLTWPKRSAHICLVFFIVWLFPLSQSLYPFATMTLSLSLFLSLSLSLWLSMLIPLAIDLYHYSESRNWLCLTYCYNATRGLQKKHILVIHFGFEQKNVQPLNNNFSWQSCSDKFLCTHNSFYK